MTTTECVRVDTQPVSCTTHGAVVRFEVNGKWYCVTGLAARVTELEGDLDRAEHILRDALNATEWSGYVKGKAKARAKRLARKTPKAPPKGRSLAKRGPIAGRWRIFEMGNWDREYFDMEVKAYITITPRDTGEFQFGLVTGDLGGEVVQHPGGERFEFTWEGQDELDPVSGSGWIRCEGKNAITGMIKIHGGESSTFRGRRAR